MCMYVSVAATWVGGAFIIGMAELVSDPTKGLIWALIPVQISISFIIGKCVFSIYSLNIQSNLRWRHKIHLVLMLDDMCIISFMFSMKTINKQFIFVALTRNGEYFGQK